MRRIVIVVFVLLLAACHARYHTTDLSTESQVKLDRQKKVFITVPEDGGYANRPFIGSGQTVAQAVAMAFADAGVKTAVAEKRLSSLEEEIRAGQQQQAAYLVSPKIALWEQRATQWSGRPSRMSLRITLFDVATGKELSSTIVEGRSRTFSFVRTAPHLLLPEPLRDYVQRLYQ